MYGCESDSMFAIRALMDNMPFKFNTIILLLSIAIFGQAVRICEAPLSRITPEMDHFDYTNSMWSVILTMTTVGYGDIYPRTFAGRIIIFIVSMVGVVIVSMVVVTVMNIFQMSPLESKAYTVIKKINIRNKMKLGAANIISQLSKLHLIVKKNENLKVSKLFELSNVMDEFSHDSRKYKNMKDVNPTEEIFREFDRLRSTNSEIMMFISVLAKMITKVNTHASSMDRINQTKDHKITQVLVQLQDREDFKIYKDQEIMNQYVTPIKN
jgi:hypothetical protein